MTKTDLDAIESYNLVGRQMGPWAFCEPISWFVRSPLSSEEYTWLKYPRQEQGTI
ncbi:uncharacterized protein ACLA_089020 [Aspergillus clavatus NRRL 1]|uniref:Uncharacterized protein n=1 Tax=Aspergillus clavatus (strain ATCC 1007 / CBS 513.65 / DSM 816 / NCTC 3887 / NRRL 1 / QM 1276 / 107) TaxID=344612 RepID=A1CEB2_ASPCL|nr:uncharacterized protein ACLA_089020 [Aspergillus clavatus NRRL 1]EAW11211.1 hypothetical protein ACLA_089020 [Aspergillus clavatus NRRL 1]